MSKTAKELVQLRVVSVPKGEALSAVSTSPGPRGHAVPKNLRGEVEERSRQRDQLAHRLTDNKEHGIEREGEEL